MQPRRVSLEKHLPPVVGGQVRDGACTAHAVVALLEYRLDCRVRQSAAFLFAAMRIKLESWLERNLVAVMRGGRGEADFETVFRENLAALRCTALEAPEDSAPRRRLCELFRETARATFREVSGCPIRFVSEALAEFGVCRHALWPEGGAAPSETFAGDAPYLPDFAKEDARRRRPRTNGVAGRRGPGWRFPLPVRQVEAVPVQSAGKPPFCPRKSGERTQPVTIRNPSPLLFSKRCDINLSRIYRYRKKEVFVQQKNVRKQKTLIVSAAAFLFMVCASCGEEAAVAQVGGYPLVKWTGASDGCWVVFCAAYVLATGWAAWSLVQDAKRKKALPEFSVETSKQTRREEGRPEKMTEGEYRKAYGILHYLAHLPKDEGGFLHRRDILIACEALEQCRELLPTDAEVVDALNETAGIARFGLTRRYVFWETGFGKWVIIGAAVLSVVLAIKLPSFLFFVLVPLVLYGIFGRTPNVVAAHPSGLDGKFTVLTFSLVGAALTSLGMAGVINETVWVNRDNQMVKREVNPTPNLVALIFAVIIALAVFMTLIIRMGIMFVRNYVVYR